MTAFRCTGKLLRAMKVTPMPHPQPAGGRLGEWTANLIRVSRMQLVVATSEPTRFGVVIDAAPYATLLKRFEHALFHALLHIEIPPEMAAAEVQACDPLEVAASTSRSVLGTLNWFATDIETAVRYRKANSAEALTRRLAKAVVLQPKHIGFPVDRVRELFDLPPLDHGKLFEAVADDEFS